MMDSSPTRIEQLSKQREKLLKKLNLFNNNLNEVPTEKIEAIRQRIHELDKKLKGRINTRQESMESQAELANRVEYFEGIKREIKKIEEEIKLLSPIGAKTVEYQNNLAVKLSLMPDKERAELLARIQKIENPTETDLRSFLPTFDAKPRVFAEIIKDWSGIKELIRLEVKYIDEYQKAPEKKKADTQLGKFVKQNKALAFVLGGAALAGSAYVACRILGKFFGKKETTSSSSFGFAKAALTTSVIGLTGIAGFKWIEQLTGWKISEGLRGLLPEKVRKLMGLKGKVDETINTAKNQIKAGAETVTAKTKEVIGDENLARIEKINKEVTARIQDIGKNGIDIPEGHIPGVAGNVHIPGLPEAIASVTGLDSPTADFTRNVIEEAGGVDALKKTLGIVGPLTASAVLTFWVLNGGIQKLALKIIPLSISVLREGGRGSLKFFKLMTSRKGIFLLLGGSLLALGYKHREDIFSYCEKIWHEHGKEIVDKFIDSEEVAQWYDYKMEQLAAIWNKTQLSPMWQKASAAMSRENLKIKARELMAGSKEELVTAAPFALLGAALAALISPTIKNFLSPRGLQMLSWTTISLVAIEGAGRIGFTEQNGNNVLAEITEATGKSFALFLEDFSKMKDVPLHDVGIKQYLATSIGQAIDPETLALLELAGFSLESEILKPEEAKATFEAVQKLKKELEPIEPSPAKNKLFRHLCELTPILSSQAGILKTGTMNNGTSALKKIEEVMPHSGMSFESKLFAKLQSAIDKQDSWTALNILVDVLKSLPEIKVDSQPRDRLVKKIFDLKSKLSGVSEPMTWDKTIPPGIVEALSAECTTYTNGLISETIAGLKTALEKKNKPETETLIARLDMLLETVDVSSDQGEVLLAEFKKLKNIVDDDKTPGFSPFVWKYVAFAGLRAGLNVETKIIPGAKPFELRVGDHLKVAVRSDPTPFESTPEKSAYAATQITKEWLEKLKSNTIPQKNATIESMMTGKEDETKTAIITEINAMIAQLEGGCDSFRHLQWDKLASLLPLLDIHLHVGRHYVQVSGATKIEEIGISPNIHEASLEYAVKFFAAGIFESAYIREKERVIHWNTAGLMELYEATLEDSNARKHVEILLSTGGDGLQSPVWWLNYFRCAIEDGGFQSLIEIKDGLVLLRGVGVNIVLAKVADYHSAPIQALCALFGYRERDWRELATATATPAAAGIISGIRHASAKSFVFRHLSGSDPIKGKWEGVRRGFHTATKPFNISLHYKVARHAKEWSKLKAENLAYAMNRPISWIPKDFTFETPNGRISIKEAAFLSRYETAIKNMDFWARLGELEEAEKWKTKSAGVAKSFGKYLQRNDDATEITNRINDGLKRLQELAQAQNVKFESFRTLWKKYVDVGGLLDKSIVSKTSRYARNTLHFMKSGRVLSVLPFLPAGVDLVDAYFEDNMSRKSLRYGEASFGAGLAGAELAGTAAAGGGFAAAASVFAAAVPVGYMGYAMFRSADENRTTAKEWIENCEGSQEKLIHELITTLDKVNVFDSYRAVFKGIRSFDINGEIEHIHTEKKHTRQKIWQSLIALDKSPYKLPEATASTNQGTETEMSIRIGFIKKRLPTLHSHNPGEVKKLLRRSKDYFKLITDGYSPENAEIMLKQQVQKEKENTKKPEIEESALAYGLYEAAKVLGYEGDGKVKELKSFFQKNHKSQKGIYWDGDQWRINEEGILDFDSKAGSNPKSIAQALRDQAGDVFKDRNWGIVDYAVFMGSKDDSSHTLLKRRAITMADAIDRGVKKFEKIKLKNQKPKVAPKQKKAA